MSGAVDLDAERRHLVKLAYRMLGSASEAEDVAQETLLRWQAGETESIRTPRAWLTRAATRRCLDRLREANRSRTAYVGVELPEPLIARSGSRQELDDSLSMALLATIQRLRPRERAVFLLHDVFDHSFEEVAEILDLESANCRQLAVRARRYLHLDAVRSDATPETVERLSEAFFAAIESGALDRLTGILAEDAVLKSDGGGKVAAAGQPIHGRGAVIDFLRAVFSGRDPASVRHRRRLWFNGAPGILVTDAAGRPETAFHFLVIGGRIHGIFAQRNPDKLRGFIS